ncbi:MAG: response regulator [Candidatus Omnitrophica bacterium]|nr:response regulator [Candidatus Omnitrophota bacterium]MCA9414714.1 response regulator [Candidatus Omnitrophota bacterium]MCB9769660.1 response regulator [Candidatus Omnitrophota bacterium]
MTDSNHEKPRVLVVDDEEVIRSLLVSFFKKDGRYEVDTAADGQLGLAALNQKPYSVVISDLQMPNMAGIPFIRSLRRAHPELPVIVFTGYGEFDDAIEALRLGAVNFLKKPTDIQNVIAAVERALDITRPHVDRQQVLSRTKELTTVVEIPARFSEKNACLQLLTEPLVPMGLTTPGEVKNILLSLDELFNNAIAYGALGIDSSIRDDPQGHVKFQNLVEQREKLTENLSKRIRVEASFTREQVDYTITDPGNGFDYESLPDPTDPENLMREHGRGLLLVQCFMDSISFNETGNSVTITKMKSQPEAEAAPH